MKSKLIIFCLETNKGKNSLDKKSDELYIKKLLDVYFSGIGEGYKIDYIHLEGKGNYKHPKIKSQIKTKVDAHKVANKGREVEVVYVLDKDEFTKEPRDAKHIKDVEKYVEGKYKLIWFTKDIEHVLLGKRTSHNKTSKARNYQVENKEELRKQLDCINPCSDSTSNFISVIGGLFK